MSISFTGAAVVAAAATIRITAALFGAVGAGAATAGTPTFETACARCGTAADPADDAALEPETVDPTPASGTLMADVRQSDASRLAQTATQPSQPARSGASVLSNSDPRTLWWVDPRRAWANQIPDASLFREVSGPNGPARDIPEPGLVGASGDMTLSRGADPSDPSRMAFRHRLARDFPLHPNRAYRSLLTQSWASDGTEVKRDVEYWVGYSVRLEADAVNGGPGLGLLGFHAVPSPWRVGYVSPVGMSFWGSQFQFIANWAYSPIDPSAGVTGQRRTLASHPARPGVWYDFVFNFRIGSSVDSGMWRIWVRERGTNVVQQIANYAGPLGYGLYNEDKYPQTFGLYSWDVPWAGQSQTATSYTKGLYIFRAGAGTPAMGVDSVMALLSSM
jgi:hypothetical protein